MRGRPAPGEASPGTFSPSGPPNLQAAITSAVATAIANSASTAIRDSRPELPARRPVPASSNRSILVAHGEPRVVLVDERLAVETERLGVRAEEAAHVRRGGQDVEALVFERPEVLGPDLGALLELGEVELLAQSGLAEAGADVEHAARQMVASRECPTPPAPSALVVPADVLQ